MTHQLCTGCAVHRCARVHSGRRPPSVAAVSHDVIHIQVLGQMCPDPDAPPARAHPGWQAPTAAPSRWASSRPITGAMGRCPGDAGSYASDRSSVEAPPAFFLIDSMALAAEAFCT